MNKIPLIVIAGPTASGKTDLAIQAAKRLDGEIVSADSMQIYRYMNIGTAKPTMEERQGIQHYMIDIVEPDEEYNAALFQKDAGNAIQEIAGRGKLPILAGGSGLYVNSIMYPMNFTDAVEDSDYRNYLNRLLETHGNLHLHRMLENVDPDSAARLHPNDTRRIIRALEVYHVTGKPMVEYRQDFRNMEPAFHLMPYGLTMERPKLYNRINLRVDNMLEAGLTEEVKGLIDMGYSKDLVSMQGLGYKEIVPYLEGLCTLEEAASKLKRETRRFAKRQMTWFRREKRICWLDVDKFKNRQELCDWLVSDVMKKLTF